MYFRIVGALLVVGALVALLIWSISSIDSNGSKRLTQKTRLGQPRPAKFLAVAATFKNEGHILLEWIQHYVNEGVEVFYLIDNGSTDNGSDLLAHHVQQGLVQLFKDDTRYAQVELMNKYLLPRKPEFEWLITADLDEFMYSRKGFPTIASYLRTLTSPRLAQIFIPWKMFGSSGHIEQPASVIQGFQQRVQYKDDGASLFKSVIRSEYLQSWFNHGSLITDQSLLTAWPQLGTPAAQQIPGGQVRITEPFLESLYLHMNHYAIQSWSFFPFS